MLLSVKKNNVLVELKYGMVFFATVNFFWSIGMWARGRMDPSKQYTSSSLQDSFLKRAPPIQQSKKYTVPSCHLILELLLQSYRTISCLHKSPDVKKVKKKYERPWCVLQKKSHNWARCKVWQEKKTSMGLWFFGDRPNSWVIKLPCHRQILKNWIVDLE